MGAFNNLLSLIIATFSNHNNLPKNIRLRATHFVNLRPYLVKEDVYEMIKSSSKVKLGNLIGYVIFPFYHWITKGCIRSCSKC
ncbi:hypothetical protein NC653_001085 [Populus alba x Populus x berolinensis]|uniref:Uncharacterized protein n=1 Tax=Populus alba x Populus x berolinensis TaxID=444605 RepID=A0AAD6RLA9_9ROSI|nr:hypothetical protein NC653_001085 [Populus alba x Populus x berolinensis]